MYFARKPKLTNERDLLLFVYILHCYLGHSSTQLMKVNNLNQQRAMKQRSSCFLVSHHVALLTIVIMNKTGGSPLSTRKIILCI